MENHGLYLMEEYNQCFKEVNIFQVVHEAREVEFLGAAVKTFVAFAVISPEHPLKLFLLNFASLTISLFYRVKTFQKHCKF